MASAKPVIGSDNTSPIAVKAKRPSFPSEPRSQRAAASCMALAAVSEAMSSSAVRRLTLIEVAAVS
jgi:hypothetical protein